MERRGSRRRSVAALKGFAFIRKLRKWFMSRSMSRRCRPSSGESQSHKHPSGISPKDNNLHVISY